jgi:hypothetical protein
MADYEETKGSSREPVRQSMVVMTGKLLGITESIAAMNLRIFVGVLFSIVLLVATFVVNILAFDYAKDNTVSGDRLVSKETGEVLRVGLDIRYGLPQFGEYQFLATEEVRLATGSSGDFTSLVETGSKMILPCPVADSPMCTGAKTYLAYTNIPNLVLYATSDADVMRWAVADESFVQAAMQKGLEEAQAAPARKLLNPACDFCPVVCPPGCSGSTHSASSSSRSSRPSTSRSYRPATPLPNNSCSSDDDCSHIRNAQCMQGMCI